LALTFQQASIEHITKLTRLINRGGVARVKKVYDQAQAELERKLARSIGSGSSPFTIHQHRALLAQVRQGQMHIARKMGVASSQATIDTQKDALGGLVGTIKRFEKKHGADAPILPLEEASKFAGVLDKRKTSLLKQNATSMAKYGAGVVQKMEGQLSLSLATGETAFEAMDRVAATADTEFWRAERIVRTEQAWAFNATIRDGIAATAEAVGGDLYMRWTEMVDDDSLEPLDDRVSADSIALHGQVARPGEQFTMPSSARGLEIRNRFGRSRVDPDMIGQGWDHPPNRPNDRSSVLPWRPGWDAPGWRCVGGVKVPVKAPRQR